MNNAKSTTWFTQARFGMFIHWGLYSNPAGVWKGKKITHNYSEWLQASEKIPRQEYRDLTETFNPESFDAEDWILQAKNAGMKYFIITTKHHDGFALWPSKASHYNVYDATPFKRDILAELADACRKHDLKLGFYYSHWQDWEGTGGDVCETHMVNEEYIHPTQEQFEAYWKNKCLPQVKELQEHYNPNLFWFDSWGNLSEEFITENRQNELIDLIKNYNPDCLINSRICMKKASERVDYLSMGDNVFPDDTFNKPWETSGTLNHSWAYHRLDFQWKPTEELIKNLVRNASLGGNYQLNVGPMGNGQFELSAIKRLKEIGAWMCANGESVYNTRSSAISTQSWGRITEKHEENAAHYLYLHLWNYTAGTALTVEVPDKKPASAYVLETGQKINVVKCSNEFVVTLPLELLGLQLPVIAIQLT